jgi:iron complex transport system ATP-binding protein
MSAINLNNVSFSYHESVPVLDCISLYIKPGETWAVIGKNGCGKSTLLKCIAGLLRTSRGTISINGKPIDSYSAKERAHRIAYVPQAGGRTLPPYPVADFVMLGRFPYQGFFALPSPEDRKIVRDVLSLTDTESLGTRAMNTLSGGELQRVFIAAAVAQKTGILLLDEPMSFLDPLHQQMIHRSLDRVHKEYGTTIVTVTHDVNLALSKFSHVCALKNGSSYFIGTAESFRKNSTDFLHEIYSIKFSEIISCNDRAKYYVPEGID